MHAIPILLAASLWPFVGGPPDVYLGHERQLQVASAEALPDPVDRFAYRPLVRDADHFFVKLSYLFRL